jgi:gliding motility-associated-like protein
MKRIYFILILIISVCQAKSQCFQIQSILVDACAGSQEGQNEMVTFQVGSTALSTANLSVNWPNNSWLGLTKNASTAADVATVNATIVGCGFLKEPTANVLPANAKVLLVTSSAWSPLAQSFANLTDTLYIIFQTAGNTAGHFANSGTGLRTLSMTFSSPASCTDAVTYDRALLINQAGNLGAQDGGAVEFSPSGLATYVNYGCQAPFIPLSVDAGNNASVCVGASQNFAAVASGAFTNVNWSLGAGATGSFAPTNSLSTTYTSGIGDNGTIKLYCSISKSCGAQTTTVKDSVLLTITPLPTVSVSPSVINLCTGQTATVQANTNTATTYTWSTGANTNTVSLNSAGIYTLNVSNSCGNSSATVSVSISSAPTLSIVSSDVTICSSGQTATLSLAGSTGTYSWSTGANTSTTTISSPGVYSATVSTSGCGNAVANISLGTAPLPIVSVLTPSSNSLCVGGSVILTANSNEGNYLWSNGATTNTVSVNSPSISVTSTNACGSSQATQTLNIVPLPTLTLSANAVSLCSGQTATVQANTNTPVTYTWSTGVNTNSASLNSAGVFSCNISNVCGNASESVTVTIGTLPSTTASATQTLLCSGQTATLSTSGSGAYLWSNGATTQTTSVSNPGVYTVTLTNSCGSAMSSVTINVQASPTVAISASSPTICSGQTSTINAISNADNYLWSTGSFTNTTVVNTPGVVTVTVSNSCGAATASTTVVSNVFPILNLTSSSTTICPNETATLSVTGGSAPYTWSNTSNTSSVVTTNGGTVAVSNTNACGTATAIIIVNVENLNASISANPVSGYSPLTVSFTNNSTNATTYLWDFGNGNVANTQTVTDQIYNNSGVYTAYLTVTNGLCMDIDSLTITVSEEEPTLYVPNAFTPNGDSINDIFWIGATNIKEFHIIIFDRWGLKLFESSDLLDSWTGKVNGKEVPDGCYFYLVNARGIDNNEIKKQGTVTLFK